MWELILIDRKHSCLLDSHKPGNPGSARREVPIPLWPHKLSWGISFRVPSGIEIQATLESLEHLSNLPQPFPISASWFSASGIGLPWKCAFLDSSCPFQEPFCVSHLTLESEIYELAAPIVVLYLFIRWSTFTSVKGEVGGLIQTGH